MKIGMTPPDADLTEYQCRDMNRGYPKTIIVFLSRGSIYVLAEAQRHMRYQLCEFAKIQLPLVHLDRSLMLAPEKIGFVHYYSEGYKSHPTHRM